MNAGTRIDSSTLWDGNAGQIAGNVGSLTLNDGAQIRSQSGGVAVATGQPSVGIGKGGSVNVHSGRFHIDHRIEQRCINEHVRQRQWRRCVFNRW